MTDDPQRAHRRRKRRASAPQGPPRPMPGPSSEAAPAATSGQQQRNRKPATTDGKPEHSDRTTGATHNGEQQNGGHHSGGRDNSERGLRDIVGAGRSQLGVSGALRARDVNRPSEQDLAEAEASVEIVRRQWTPPKDSSVPTGRTRRR